MWHSHMRKLLHIAGDATHVGQAFTGNNKVVLIGDTHLHDVLLLRQHVAEPHSACSRSEGANAVLRMVPPPGQLEAHIPG